MLLSRDPDARNGPGCLAPLPPATPPFERLSSPAPSVEDAAASLMAAVAVSGAHAMHSTTWSCARNSTLQSLVCSAHTRTVWSLEHDAMRSPSAWTRTILTHSRWPLYVFTQ